MGKSSKSITLALIGSALLMAGCQTRDEEPIADANADFGATADGGGDFGDPASADGQAAGTPHNGNGIGRAGSGVAGAIIGSRIAGSMLRGGGGGASAPVTPSAPSARGGFGATGSGFGASS